MGLCADVRVSAFRFLHRRRVLRLAQGCRIRHRRRRPACYLGAIRMLVGFVLGGPPGRRMARQPPASCGLTGRAMDDRSAGVLAGGAPTSDNLIDQCAIDRRATPRLARRCAILERRHPVTSARRRDPVRWGGSRARTPGSRLPHRAQRIGGRMPPMLRNPLRPGGPRKTNPATIRITIEAAGRMPASIGVSSILGQAAGRGVGAQVERGHGHIRAEA